MGRNIAEPKFKPTGIVGCVIGTIVGVILGSIDRVCTCICGYVAFSLCESTKSKFWLTNGVDDIDNLFSCLFAYPAFERGKSTRRKAQ